MTQSHVKNTGVIVADIIQAMEKIAPPELAEEWDNSGLQVGSRLWPVRKIWVSLDPHPVVIQAAAAQKVDMVITHHPLLFRPLSCLDLDNPVGNILATAITSQIAVYAAHTNFDCAGDGMNDILAQRIGLKDSVPLVSEEECRGGDRQLGLGRVGILPEPMSLRELAQSIKTAMDLSMVRISGDPHLSVQQVALCSGSGSGLLDSFLATEAQVYISGDLHYHDARTTQDFGRGLIDIGHFPSERIMIESVADQLRETAGFEDWPVSIEPCYLEKDPFEYI
jgi:dinuclear metal center YbgI/SA1388 family protein